MLKFVVFFVLSRSISCGMDNLWWPYHQFVTGSLSFIRFSSIGIFNLIPNCVRVLNLVVEFGVYILENWPPKVMQSTFLKVH